MPTGRVKWYNTDKGFGFVSRDDGGSDVFLHRDALPEGVTDLKPGQKLEYGIVDTRRGVQAMSVTLVEAPQRLKKAEPAPQRRSPDELHGLIEDMIKVLEDQVMPPLRHGRRPDRKQTAKIAEVVHAVARELEQ
ncbi:cold shock domain-containing protein [Stackebrandtia albiflava]|uniref:cold shock domain-containing protein n=1 Tax=Stackebrandtia albiflava TaxID=406432 RepID=UPI0011BEE6DD